MALMKEKRVTLGDVQFAVAIDATRVARLRQNPAYRFARHRVLPLVGQVARRMAIKRAVVPSEPAINGHVSATAQSPFSPEVQVILDQIKGIDWYHTIDLPHGVATPGIVDHRSQVHHYGLAAEMRGLRCLDVATYDGFWAFEMERRGADVVAVDLETLAQCDMPRGWRAAAIAGRGERLTGAGFKLARELLDSRVERRFCSVYDLSPEKLGMFDLVFVSDLLLHLRDPFSAMEAVYSVTKDEGHAIFADVYNPQLDAFTNMALTEFAMYGEMWYLPSVAAFRKMLEIAGFERVEEVSRFKLDTSLKSDLRKVVLRCSPYQRKCVLEALRAAGNAFPQPAASARAQTHRL